MAVLAFFGAYFLIGFLFAVWEIYKDNSGMGMFGFVLMPFWPVFLDLNRTDKE